ncbi:MAG TPA: ParB/RepB/Spo0J family partition protein, partial [Oscillatoriaceae cyanobacterium]
MSQTTTSLRAFDQLAIAKRQSRGTPIPQLPLDQIAPMPGQPRQSFDPESLAELAESIKAHGVIQPIIVIARKQISETDRVRYSIVCGERRYQAATRAGLATIPALVRDYEDDEAAVLALLENLQREDLTPLEEGEYLSKLKQKYGFTEEQLGERLGKTRDYVHMRTRLLKLSPDILEAWKQAESTKVFDTLTPSHASLINQLDEDGLRQALTQAVLMQGITVA